MAKALAAKLVQLSPDVIIHSDRIRTRKIAKQVADILSINAHADHRWRERDFGSWEGRSWNAIYRETGNAMDGMLNDPHGFRPGGGETTAEVEKRSIAAWRDLPPEQNIAVISHGGPIGLVLAKKNNASIHSVANFIPALASINKA